MADTSGIYENYEPTFERVVKQKRFNPRKKLEENTRRRLEREAEAEEIRLQSQPASRQVPTVFGTPRRPRRKVLPPRQLSREDDLMQEENDMTTLTPSKRCYDEMSSITQEYNDDPQQRDQTMMPKPPVKPPRRFQKKMDQQETESQMQKQQWLEGDYEYLLPRDVPQREPKTKLFDSPVYETHAQIKKSSIIKKKPVLARWPLAFKDLDAEESPAKRARIEPPPDQTQTTARGAPGVPGAPGIPEAPGAPEAPGLPGAPRALRSRRPYLETVTEELKRIPPPKPPRKSPPKSRADEQVQLSTETKLDPFCTSLSVFSLDTTNFRDFLGDKNAALVMFYKPFKSSCVKGRKYFVKAAETNQREDSAFAGVDCSVEEDLCLKEGIRTVPTYKVYAQGQLVNTVNDYLFFNDRSMKRFIDNVPPFTQDGINKPPCRSEHSWLKKAFLKLKP